MFKGGCGQLLMGLVFMGVGISVALGVGKLTTLECKRSEPSTNQGTCLLSSQGIIGSKTIQTIAIESLQGAKVEDSCDSDGCTYRVEVLTKQGTIPLTSFYSSGESGKQENANQIRSFVDNRTQVNLSLKQDDRWFGYLFGGVFGGVGALMVVSSPIRVLKKGL